MRLIQAPSIFKPSEYNPENQREIAQLPLKAALKAGKKLIKNRVSHRVHRGQENKYILQTFHRQFDFSDIIHDRSKK